MKSATLALLASAAVLANGQVTYNNNTGKFTCDRPNVAYCAGDSLRTDIIFRCDSEGNAQPGRCSDNLAGEPPVGVNLALCYQTSETSGDAACEKNCVVYGSSGNGNGTFTLPPSLCNATYTPSSSVPAPTSSLVINATTSTHWITTTVCDSTDVCTSTGVVPHPQNQTVPTPTPTFVSSTTHVPTGPSKSVTPPSQVTAGASSLQMGGSFLAAAGLVAAYLL